MSWIPVSASLIANGSGAFCAVVEVEADTDHSSRREVVGGGCFHVTMAAEAAKHLNRGYRSDIHT